MSKPNKEKRERGWHYSVPRHTFRIRNQRVLALALAPTSIIGIGMMIDKPRGTRVQADVALRRS